MTEEQWGRIAEWMIVLFACACICAFIFGWLK